MIYLKFIKYLCSLLIIFIVCCNNFEREDEVIRLLKSKKVNIESSEALQIFILQDNICGACTGSVLSFIYSLDLQNSIAIVSNDNKKLVEQLKTKFGDQKIIIDSTRLIDRYGLRYASDLIISVQNGKVDFWSFLEEDKFNKIKRKLKH